MANLFSVPFDPVIAGPAMSVLESQDYIYINGQAHEKDTLNPVFGKFLGANNAYECALRMRKTLFGNAANAEASMARDTTLVNPASLGWTYPTYDSADLGASFTQYNTVNGYGNTVNECIYGRNTRSNGMQEGVYAQSSSIFTTPHVFLGADAGGAYILALTGQYISTGGAITRKFPVAAAAAPTAINTIAYARVCAALSENDAYWFVAAVSGSTNPTAVAVFAINKTTLASTTVYSFAAQGTGYPSAVPSAPFNASADSKYSYCAVANAAAPLFTIRYINYNQSSLSATAGACTIDWGATSAAAEFAASNRSSALPLLRCWTIHTDTADYVCFGLSEQGGGANEVAANMKVYVFTINPANPTQLTWKQTIAVGAEWGYIKSLFPLTDDHTRLGVVTSSAMYLYNFTDAAGYDYSGVSIPHNIFTATAQQAGAIGVDELGRIWTQDAGGKGALVKMYAPTTSATVRLTFASSSYNYTGSDIATSFNLSAYNADGNRVATDVQVVLDSGNITFADSTTTKTITTSASAETTVNVTITGPGQVRAIANVAV